MASILGVILTGGAARRMGGSKHDRRLPDGRRLLDVAAATLRAAGPAELIAVGRPPGVPPDALELALEGGERLPLVPDARPGEGPLAGLAVALAEAASRGHDRVLIVPCDMPGLAPADLARLAGHPAALVHPASGGLPLAADVTPVLAASVAARLGAGRRRLGDLLAAAGAVPLALDEAGLARHANINWPADLRRVR